MGFGMRFLDSLVKSTVNTIGGASRPVATPTAAPATQPTTGYTAPSQMASNQPSLEEKQRAMLAKYKKDHPTAPAPAATAPAAPKEDPYSPRQIGERFLAQCPEYKLTDKDVHSEEEMDQYINYVFGYVALCNYLIHIDGEVTQEEADEVARIIGCLRRTKEIPTKYRQSFSNAMISSVMTFDDVRKYLDKTDRSSLIYLGTRAQDIAAISGITDKEQMAVDSFLYYIEQKTGHRFDHVYKEKAPVNLTCPTCASVLKLDKTLSMAKCPYCGFTRILDANRIEETQKEIAREEALSEEKQPDT
ncbi:MAG: hypothetical protein IK020_10390 [Clostridiales bacterium]|nr:hypothetical protein [Clostridiales bacterium]